VTFDAAFNAYTAFLKNGILRAVSVLASSGAERLELNMTNVTVCLSEGCGEADTDKSWRSTLEPRRSDSAG